MPASGGKRDPPAKAMPASGGKRDPPAVQSKSSSSKGAEAEKGNGKLPAEWKTLASGRSIHPDARYSQQNPEKDGKLVARDLAEELAEWKAWPSHALLEPTGLADFAKRNTCLEEEGRLPWHLIAKLPSDPSAAAWRKEGWEVDVPATGGAEGAEDAWGFIRDLCLRHRGEVRELRGRWAEYDGPLPREMLNPQFKGSFVRVSGQMALQGRLAAGSQGRRGELEVRKARVFGLADLFYEFGERYTARELYEFWMTCRVIATRRSRGQQAWSGGQRAWQWR